MAKKIPPPPASEPRTLAQVIASINKKAGEQVIGKMKNLKTLNIERIATGIPALDDAIGGGFPRRRIVELYGLPSGGKSLISMLVIAAAQKQGLECIYVDIEDSFDPSFATKLGVNVDNLAVAQSSIGEDTMDMLCTLLEAKPGVIVVDSVAAMITRGEMTESFDQAFMAPKARLMSRGLAKLTALNTETLIIFINQLRSTMALYGAKTTTTGGRALGHYASIRCEVKRGDPIFLDGKKTQAIIGQVVQFYVVKNKTHRPFLTGSFQFYYDDGRVVI